VVGGPHGGKHVSENAVEGPQTVMRKASFTLVSTWNNGSRHASGAGYGIRFSRGVLETIFQPNTKSIRLRIGADHATEHTVRISNSFWTGCPEVRDQRIGIWLKILGLDHWETGRPHKLVFEHCASHYLLRDLKRGTTYAPLNDYLTLCKATGCSEAHLSFPQIELMLRRPLPKASSTLPAWWSNTRRTHVQAEAWMAAGYSAEVNLDRRSVVFVSTK
jgi:hypothetical protein